MSAAICGIRLRSAAPGAATSDPPINTVDLHEFWGLHAASFQAGLRALRVHRSNRSMAPRSFDRDACRHAVAGAAIAGSRRFGGTAGNGRLGVTRRGPNVVAAEHDPALMVPSRVHPARNIGHAAARCEALSNSACLDIPHSALTPPYRTPDRGCASAGYVEERMGSGGA
jgi:hypothetical protein